MTLSHRAETAKPEDARELLEELWHVGGNPRPVRQYNPIHEYWYRTGDERTLTFWKLLDINTPEAHLAAAMMLVPEGDYATISTKTPAAAVLGSGSFNRWHYAATPALALISAIARSQE